MFKLFTPWRRLGRLVRSAGYVLTSLPMSIVTFTTMVVLIATAIGLAVTFFLAIPVVLVGFGASRWLGRVERNRTAALM
ncbi:MAG: sensor domain-containing protein, partial [Desertimonas sp.]